MKKYQIQSKNKIKLKNWEPEDTGGHSKDKGSEKKLKNELKDLQKKIRKLQERLYAQKKQSLLVVLQAMDTGGKDSTIRNVFSVINPQGCRVHSFKKPTPLELSHHFLWRVFQKVPPKGFIGIFNRSHYEDVLITRVHKMIPDKVARRRLEEIRDFEMNLSNSQTKVVKFYLHISKDEQRRRLQDRLDDPEKHWKFNIADLKERKYWQTYQKYYEAALWETSTKASPWYVIPANNKWYRNWLIGSIIYDTLKAMYPIFPPVPKDFNHKKIKIT